jgi:hypothetical protein
VRSFIYCTHRHILLGRSTPGDRGARGCGNHGRGGDRNVYRVLMEKPEGKRPLEEWILRRLSGGISGSICVGMGVGGGLL